MQVLIMWTSENTLKLIEDLHSLPCLWDVQSAEYKNRNKKIDAYDTLASKYSVSVMQVEKKIQALKTQFRREHRKLVSKTCGGSRKKAAWFGYEQLLFLLQGNESKISRSTDNAYVQIEEENAHQLSYSDPESNFQTDCHEREEKSDKTLNFRIPAPKRSKKITNEDGSVQEALQCMNALIERISKRDDHSVYGEHVGNKLRSCGRSIFEISIAQHHIDEILFNLTMGAYGQHPYSSTYGTHAHLPLTITTGQQNCTYSDPPSSSSSPSPSSPSRHSDSVPPTSIILPSSDTPHHSQSAKENGISHP